MLDSYLDFLKSTFKQGSTSMAVCLFAAVVTAAKNERSMPSLSLLVIVFFLGHG